MIGKTIGRFRILERLGQGGMATVWKAADDLQERFVALKVLKEDLAELPGARLRFEREARSASVLDHPSIAAVHEWGEFDGFLYMAMTYVDGATLSQLLEQRLLPMDEALRIVEQVADALDYAHARGVVHRDVSSRNIMVARDGRVFVLDFGIALVPSVTRLTTTGKIIGTAAYIAPEILEHQEASPKSDLYSLGVVLYEALTGRLPYDAERPEVLILDVLTGPPPPPSQRRPEVGSEVDRLVLRAIAADPDDRYRDAKQVKAEIRALRQDLGARVLEGRAVPPDDRALQRTVAERLASGSGPIYLGILPVRAELSGVATELLPGILEACSAAAASPQRVHVVPLPGRAEESAEQDLRSLGRAAGVNAVMLTTVRVAGTALRLVYRIVETETGTQIGGDLIEGSLLSPFEVEDRLVRSLRATLGVPDSGRRAARLPDPAAEDRFLQAIADLKRFDNEASVDGAIAALESLVERDDSSAPLFAALARAYLYKLRLTRERVWEGRAASACARAERLDPRAAEVLLALGELDVAARRWTGAIARFDELLAREPQSFDGRLGRARALDGAGRGDEAEAACREVVLSAPGDWRARHVLAVILFRRGRYDEAATHWAEAVRLTPDNAGALRDLGSAYFHLDRYGEAEEAFRLSLAIRPNAMAYYNLGTIQFFLERYEECVSSFERAVDLNPSDPLTWGNLGNACRLIPGREARAREALERAVALMRERLERTSAVGEGWARMAGWLVGLGQTEEALRAIGRALEVAPDDVHCIWGAGHVYFLAGRREEALEYLARAVQSGYGVDALRRDPDLRPLQSDPEFRRILRRGASAARTVAKTQKRSRSTGVGVGVSSRKGGRT